MVYYMVNYMMHNLVYNIVYNNIVTAISTIGCLNAAMIWTLRLKPQGFGFDSDWCLCSRKDF